MLRETGLISPKNVCFVCTGNTCRSPMAAAVTNALGGAEGVKAVSAGLYPHTGEPVSDNAVEALYRAGYRPCEGNRFDTHTARAIDESVLASCDMIVAVTKAHMMTLICSFPAYAQKIHAMPKDISDPFGGSVETYVRTLEEITAGVKELFGFDSGQGGNF